MTITPEEARRRTQEAADERAREAQATVAMRTRRCAASAVQSIRVMLDQPGALLPEERAELVAMVERLERMAQR